MAAEAKIQKKFITYLESEGCYVVKVISATRSGVHDIIGCYEGIFFTIEVKTPTTKNKVSKLQLYNLDQVMAAGGHSIVAWELEQVEDFIKGLL